MAVDLEAEILVHASHARSVRTSGRDRAAPPHRQRQRRPTARRRGRSGATRPPRPRLPRVVVLLASPAPGAGRQRLPRRGHRRPRLRALVGAGADRGLPHAAHGRRHRRPRPCARRGPGRRRRPRLGSADRLELGAAASRRVPRRGRALRALRPGWRRAAERRLPRHGRRRGVLHRVLPATRPRRGRDRAGRAPLAPRLLLVGIR